MLKYILIILFACTPVLADTIPHQSKELTEIYTRSDPIMYKNLELEHTYKVFDQIFILPDEFYGEAELYDLKFYLDQDTTIGNEYDANCYRILYENRMPLEMYPEIITEPIPEPLSITLFFVAFTILISKKKKN